MPDQNQPVLDHMSIKQMPAFAQVMPRVSAEYGKSLSAQLRDLIAYCLRGNKLTVDEYYAMCLFDDHAIPPDEKRRYVGLQKSRDIWGEFLEKNGWTGVIDDKLAYEKLLAGFGFKTAQTLAIIGGHYPEDHPRRLASLDALAEFLSDAVFPIFGKPANSRQSLGSARFAGYDAKARVLTLSGNRTVSLDELWAEIAAHFGGIYLFQELIEADPALGDICGDGLPTARIVTLDSGAGPEIFRAAIKLTGKGNVADNFWREGNLLAPVDADTGHMGAALTAMGIDGRFVETHPDTGARIEGVTLPHWQACRQMAIEAASVTGGALIIGFDIAISRAGPVLIEANYDPHLIMMQACHRKGVLDEKMQAGLAHVKRLVANEHAGIKAHVLAERAQNKKDMAEALGRKVA